MERTTIRRPDPRFIAWLAVGAALVALGCAAASGARRSEPGTVVIEEGRASYYSAAFNGRRTASGERYDPRALTAAHPTLPFGTRVRVTRQDGRAAVEVRVNDRCGCTHGRIIDLSHEAARRLGMLEAGVLPVRLEVVPR